MTYFSEYTWLVVIASFVLIVMAFAIGANDVGNAFATSVGSRCLSMRNALLICALMEFVGALALGGNVTNTIAQGILDLHVFARTPGILMYGMLCSISSATIICLVATLWELPVSTAHSVVASVVAFGLVYGGPEAVIWYKRVDYYPYFHGVAPVLAGWLLSPFVAALVAALLFITVRSAVLRRRHSLQISYWMLPVLVLITFFVNVFFILYKDKGMTYSLGFDVKQVAWIAAIVAAGGAMFTGLLVVPLLKRSVQHHVERRTQVRSQQMYESAVSRASALNPFQSSHRQGSLQPQDSSIPNGHYTLTLPSSPSALPDATQTVPSHSVMDKWNAAMSVNQTVSRRQSKDSSTHLSVLALDFAEEGKKPTVADLHVAFSSSSTDRHSTDGSIRPPSSTRKNVAQRNGSWHGPASGAHTSPPGRITHRVQSDSRLARMDQDDNSSRHDDSQALNRLKPTVKSSPFAALAAMATSTDRVKPPNGTAQQVELVVSDAQADALLHKPTPIQEVSNETSHLSGSTVPGAGKPAQCGFNWDVVEELCQKQQQEVEEPNNAGKGIGASEASHAQSTIGSSIRSFLSNFSTRILMIRPRSSPNVHVMRTASGRLQSAGTRVDSWCLQLLWFDVLKTAWVEMRTGVALDGGPPRTWAGRFVNTFWYAINYDVHDLISREEDTLALHQNAESFDPDTEQTFKLVQVFTASVAAFSHGANDLANTIGPFAAIWAVYTVQRVDDNTTSPMWAIALAAAGIVLGLAACGYKIIGVLGVKSVAITPSRGFTIELSTALIISLGSHFGIPLSTTHCQVGGTGGVGLAEGSWHGVNARQFRRFFWAWLGSIVFAGLLTAALFIQGTSAPTLRIANQVSNLEDTVVAKTIEIYCMLNYTNHQPGPGPTNSTLDYLISAGLKTVTSTGTSEMISQNDDRNVTFQVTRLSQFDTLLVNAMQLLKDSGMVSAGSIDACL